jgi:hypothetical protein
MSASGTGTRRLSGAKTSAKRSPLVVEHEARAGQLHALQRLWSGRSATGLVVEDDDFAEVDRGGRHGFVLAELAVGRDQVLEVEALQHLGPPGHGAWVVHGGGDQVVEVDVLDVEGAPHMGAAVPQELHDLGFVALDSEFGLDRLRPGRHLGQRERGCEYLDQNGAHGRIGASGATRLGIKASRPYAPLMMNEVCNQGRFTGVKRGTAPTAGGGPSRADPTPRRALAGDPC